MKKAPQISTSGLRQSKGRKLLSWSVPEYVYHEKNTFWKFCAIVVIMGMIVYGILSDSYPFAIVIALFAGVYGLVHKPPKKIEIHITDMGVEVDHYFYPYSNIRNFWIIFKPGEVETLNLRLMKNVVKEVSVLMGDQDPAEIRETLARFVPELVGKDEGFFDWLIRKLRL